MTGEKDTLVQGLSHLSINGVTEAKKPPAKISRDQPKTVILGLADLTIGSEDMNPASLQDKVEGNAIGDIDEILGETTDQNNSVKGDLGNDDDEANDDRRSNSDSVSSESHSTSSGDVNDDFGNDNDYSDDYNNNINNDYTSDSENNEGGKWDNTRMDSVLNEDEDEDEGKIFGFTLPFNGATDFIDDIKIFKNKRFLLTRSSKDEAPKLIKKLNEFTKVFKSKKKVVPLKPLPAKRPYHAKSPYPPEGTSIYWDEISDVSMANEMDLKEEVKLKLERQESLDTLIEAVCYKDISHLDDGKLKALGKSLLPEKPIKTINKISSLKLKRELSPTNTSLLSIPESTAESYPAITQIIQDGSKSPEIVPSPSQLSEKTAENLTSIDNMISAPAVVVTDEQGLSTEPTNSFTELKLSATKMFTTASNYSTSLFSKEQDVFDKLDGDIIVLGGYRGSTLRSVKSKRRLWIPNIRDGVVVKKNSLRLGHKDEDELRELNAREYVFSKKHKNLKDKINRPRVYPDGMLTHIGPVDISRKLLKKLNANPKVIARDWGYDWRLSLNNLSKQLHDYIKTIVDEQKEKKGVILIAHSMGGLVAHGAMVLDPSLVRGVLYAGTPMPCCNILGPLRFTDAILFNKDLLSLESNFFMRSSFIFLPPSWNGDDGMCLFRDLTDGHKYHIDFWNPVNWITYNLNPMVSLIRLQNDVKKGVIKLEKIDSVIRKELESVIGTKVDPKTYEIVKEEINRLSKPVTSFIDAYSYLRRTLERTKAFLQTLERNENVNYPPLAQIFSNGVPSVKYSLVNGEEAIKRGEYYRFFYGPGDGVLYQGWTFPRLRGRYNKEEPPKYGYNEKYAYDLCGRFHGSSAHIALLTDLKLVGKGLEALLEEENRRKNIGMV